MNNGENCNDIQNVSHELLRFNAKLYLNNKTKKKIEAEVLKLHFAAQEFQKKPQE